MSLETSSKKRPEKKQSGERKKEFILENKLKTDTTIGSFFLQYRRNENLRFPLLLPIIICHVHLRSAEQLNSFLNFLNYLKLTQIPNILLYFSLKTVVKSYFISFISKVLIIGVGTKYSFFVRSPRFQSSSSFTILLKLRSYKRSHEEKRKADTTLE